MGFLPIFFAAFTALGCGGDGVETDKWALDRREYSGRFGLPFLSPANDSRLNLRLLMLDLRPQPVVQAPASADANPTSAPLFTRAAFSVAYGATLSPDVLDDPDPNDTIFSDQEGTRCVSADSGRDAYLAAVQAEPALSADERKALAAARMGLQPNCQTPFTGPDKVQVSSPIARDFAAYVDGALAFYRGEFDPALTSFRALLKTSNAWLRETSRYMVARTLLNKAEIGAFAEIDGAPEPKVKDKDSLSAAEKELKSFVADFPQSRYAASARGLLRRVYWLGGDKDKLAAEYGWQFAHVGEGSANLDRASLSQEIDSKYLDVKSSGGHDPNLLAIEDLMRMRKSYDLKPVLTAEELKAQRPDFAGNEVLFAYLQSAQALYVKGDAKAALDTLGPRPSGVLSPPRLGFSREILRGEALMAAGRSDDAIAHWRSLLGSADLPWERDAVELGLALAFERAGELNKAFEGETRISSSRLRAILLRYEAGPILLREAIGNPLSTDKERALARFVLLYKEATHGQYANFLRDFTPEAAKDGTSSPLGADKKASVFAWAGDKTSYACPAFVATMRELAADPHNSHGRLCLAEFLRQQSLDDFDAVHPEPEELGGGKVIFPGAPYVLGDVYKAILAETATPERDKAYAVYRLINCYATSGNNHCGGKEVDQAQRKAWFQLLKTRYADTTWAKSQKFFW